MQILKKILNVVIDVLIILMLVMSVVVAGLALASKADGVPNLLGYAPLSVQSDSMVPTFESGDLIISKVMDEETALEVGDVITYATNINGVDVLNTHRITEIQTTDNINFYVTKGDNNPSVDEEPVYEGDVLAKYTETKFDGLGTVYDFITSQLGFFLIILLPLILFFLYELFRFIRNLLAYNKEKAMEEAIKASAAVSNSGLSEEEMKLAVEKYLQQQAENKDASGSHNTEQEENSDIHNAEE